MLVCVPIFILSFLYEQKSAIYTAWLDSFASAAQHARRVTAKKWSQDGA
jgi:hypothetical protein